jgi:hypothetical protein
MIVTPHIDISASPSSHHQLMRNNKGDLPSITKPKEEPKGLFRSSTSGNNEKVRKLILSFRIVNRFCEH